MPTYSDTCLYINDEWCHALRGKTLPVTDPASGEIIGRVAHAEIEDLDLAVTAAVQGFAIWRNTSAYDRSKVLRKAAELLRQRIEEIAYKITHEQGKTLREARTEVHAASDIIDWFSEEARRTFGQIIPSRTTNVSQSALKIPVGPVAAFTPWNFPITQAVRKVAAALAAGCSIILKAPEETPASPAELIKAFVDAGIPHGVVNLIYGTPSEISNYLIRHPAIRKISFTGSTQVGKHLAGLAGQHMKPVTMELGGHAPVLIFNDADIKQAVRVTVAAKFRNAGQVCVAPSRFLVHKDVANLFIDEFIDAVEAIKVGAGLDNDTDMGPVINDRRVHAIQAMVDDAVTKGAVLRAGGNRIGNKGSYFEPTVLIDTPISAVIMNEEPFAPVAVINRFANVEDAIKEANRLPLGLASYAFTRSIETISELIQRIEAGMLTINHSGLALPETPFGGVKDSGYGTEGGSEAIDAYLETRFITLMT